MKEYLNRLNNMQRKAATSIQGPLLILAGAGSGKTTVLVNRLAYILDEENESPFRLLAITFTNKAADEMKERARNLIGPAAEQMWIGTFHSVCLRILRTCAERIGYAPGFVIYDTADTKTVLKDCFKELDLDDKHFPMRSAASRISRAKDELMLPEVYKKNAGSDRILEKTAEVYELYQKKLKNSNAMDFDDIIVNTIRVLTEFPEILDKYSQKFKYIMVDEYQDTNNAQYMLISLLSSAHRNLCVVGDDDQSIYKFRGANIRNILDFEAQFPDAEVIRLEQNYRSTQNILDAANHVISNNRGRKGKKLWTDRGSGEKIVSFCGESDLDEARFVTEKILKHTADGGSFRDCAVLYRMNALSRTFEESFMRNSVPYRVLSGLKFYDRKEVKDMLAYLRLIYNETDNIAFKRVVNEPKRGIGLKSIETLEASADENNISLFEAAERLGSGRAAEKLKAFCSMIRSLQKAMYSLPLKELFEKVLTETGYGAMIALLEPAEAESRGQNISELLSAAVRYTEDAANAAEAAALAESSGFLDPDSQAAAPPSLGGFLESTALVSDADGYDETQDAVVMMTVHSAKGLEFPIVFLPGMENGLFPGARSLSEPEEIEEERRLCYVAITRAKDRLYITRATRRMYFGTTKYLPPSMFTDELPPECIDDATPERRRPGGEYFGGSSFGGAGRGAAGNIFTVSHPERGRVDFKAGDRVIHRKFGAGVITDAQPIGNDTKLEIIFGGTTKKILMAAFAKLEKIE